VSNQVSHPYNTTEKITVVYILIFISDTSTWKILDRHMVDHPLHSFTFLDCKSLCKGQIVTETESCTVIRSLILRFVDRIHHHPCNIIWQRNVCGISVDMQKHWNRRQAMLTAVSFRRSEKWRGNLVIATNSTRLKTSNPILSAHMTFISLKSVNQVIFILGSVFVRYEMDL
jgi:hypothetical protein